MAKSSEEAIRALTFIGGFRRDDANPDIGDSAITETMRHRRGAGITAVPMACFVKALEAFAERRAAVAG